VVGRGEIVALDGARNAAVVALDETGLKAGRCGGLPNRDCIQEHRVLR
jgi:hypothetical protein